MHKLLLLHSLCRLKKEMALEQPNFGGCISNLTLCKNEIPTEDPSHEEKVSKIEELEYLLLSYSECLELEALNEKIRELWQLFGLEGLN